MRKNRLTAAIVSTGVAVGLVAGLAGCAAPTAPLTVAGGIGFCVPNPQAHTEGFAIDARNSAAEPITILSARAGGANLRPGRSWLFPVDDGTVAIGQLTPPYSSTSGWAVRSGLPAVIKPRTNAQVFVTMTFPGGITSAELEGVTVRYRAADGLTHSVKSNVDAKFKDHC